jgi:hypothetical protein
MRPLMRSSSRFPSLLAPLGLCLALGLPTIVDAAPGKAKAKAKGPSPARLVKNAKASPLYQRSMTRGELKANGLETVSVANGTKMKFLKYVKGSALDVRPEFAPLFKPGLPAGVLDGTPTYKETIHQLEDRLIIDRTLVVPLADGACDKPGKLPKSVRGLCFRKTGKGKIDKALKQELADARAKLAAAPPTKIAKGTVTAEQAAKMNDAQLLGLILNHDDRTIRHVSVVPVMATDPSQPVDAFGKKLVPLPAELPSKVKGGSTSPIKPPHHAFPVGAKDFDREYFLTGWTFGRQFSDTWEYTIAGSTWFTDRYYIKFQYMLSLGLGVRAPFSVDVKSAGNGSGGVDVEMSVDPVETDDQGKPAYPEVGLPESKYFGGKEFVLEAYATCSLYISIPGPNVDENCPTLGKNYSREIKPVIGSETSNIRDWWLEGKDTGLGLSIGVAGAYVDLGLGADLTNGRIGMNVDPLVSSSIVGVNNNRVTFGNRNPFTFKVNRSTATNDAGFSLTKPRYGFDIRLVPKVRVKLEVDVAIYENDWTLGPWNIDQLAVSVGFELPHHAGTVDKHTYKVFAGSVPDQVFDPGTSPPPPPTGPKKPPHAAPPTAGKMQ